MLNLGGWEWIILLMIVLIVFGVGRLPEIGGAIGKSIREFRESSRSEENKPEKEVKKASEPAKEQPDETKTAA